jgi:hypothetical protein
MDRNNILQRFREVDTEVNITVGNREISFASEFLAKGQAHSFHFGYDYESDRHILAIGAKDDGAAAALENGTLVDIPRDAGFEGGYNRAILTERAMIGGLPLEDAVRLTEAISDYAELESALGTAEAPAQSAKTPGQQPSVEMTFQKRF